MTTPDLTRKAIRADAVARLKAAATLAGNNVFKSRTSRFGDDVLPGLNVLTSEEQKRGLGEGAPSFRAELTLAVEVLVAETDDADDTLDDLVDQVEAALMTDPEWVRAFERVVSVDSRMGIANDGDKRHASAVVAFRLQYTAIFDPVVPDDLTTLDADFDPDAAAEGRPTTTDSVTLPNP